MSHSSSETIGSVWKTTFITELANEKKLKLVKVHSH